MARIVLCAGQEARPIMQSSAAVAVRALVMLACVVGIPLLAMSGTSWSEIVKKFQNFRWPTILSPASASTTDGGDDDSPSTSSNEPGVPPIFGETSQDRQPCPTNRASLPPAKLPPLAAAPSPVADTAVPTTQQIEQRLQRLGATYYLLETWGNDEQLYRFSCQAAAGGTAGFTHYFEAVEVDPLRAMLKVLQQVEAWRQQ
jgi:hypothetical protein